MNITHFGDFSSTSVNGVSAAGHTLIAAQAAAGHRVAVYSLGDAESASESSDGISRRVFCRERNPFRLPRSLAESLRPASAGIFHLHSVFTPSNFALSNFLYRNRIPYVVTPHGGYHPEVFAKGRIKKAIYWQLFERRYVRHASGVVCLSRREVQDVRARGFRGRVLVAPNSLNLADWDDFQRNPEPRGIFMGRWDLHGKGIDRLLDLFGLMRSINGGLQLKLYGSGDTASHQSLHEMIQQVGDSNIEVCEPVFGPNKRTALAKAAVYLQFSRWEVFGLSIAEAMAAGVPVVVSRESYIADLIQEVGCGLVVDRYDSITAERIVELIRDSEQNFAMGLRGANYAREAFSPEKVAAQTCDFYRETLEEDRSSYA